MEIQAMQEAVDLLVSVSVILIIGMIAGRLASLLRIPDVALFLLVGILVGPAFLGLLHIPSGSQLHSLVLIFGASYIIFEGGASIRWEVLSRIFPTVILLSTAGVVLTLVLTGYLAHWILGLPLMTALLLGAIVAGTDPATLVPVFRQVRIREKVSQTVISESAFNDATSAIAFFSLLSLTLLGEEFHAIATLWRVLISAGGGLVIGLLYGLLGVILIAHRRYNFFLEYAPLLTLFVVIAAYGTAEHYHLSGFMAVFITGICFGNINDLPWVLDKKRDDEMHHFIGVIALGLRMGIFILLGSQLDILSMGAILSGGLLTALGFIFLIRPLVVLACALPDRRAQWTFKEILFLCWTRETGALPAALSGIALGSGVAGSSEIVSVTSIIILATILLQATTARMVARRLGLLISP